jgi:RNA polymerase sigma factor (sigma-70 family)
MSEAVERDRAELERASDSGARKRVAIEMVAKHENALRRTARRFSICAEDAEDAFQRALEILLLKAPPGEARDLIRWMQTVTKHEALAIRRGRERQLSAPRPLGESEETIDWVALIPAAGAGPAERAERREELARSREALQSLKPAELRALTLLAEGYSYAEIGELTGWTRTKVNRCLAEGRERFRAFISRSESGGRCTELGPLLSAFADGETRPEEAATVREHLRACAHCRAVMRAYRAAPRAAAALAPAPLAAHPLLDRLHEALGGLHARLSGSGRAAAESAVTQAASTGGTRGAGLAGLAKLLAICAGTAGGAAACVGAGIVPAPLGLASQHRVVARPAAEASLPEAAAEQDAPAIAAPGPAPMPQREPAVAEGESPEPEPTEPPPAQAGAVEYPTPPASPPPEAPQPPPTSGDPAGEFGP